MALVFGDSATGAPSGLAGPPSGSVLKRLGCGALLLGAATVVMVIAASAVGPFNIPIPHTVTTLLDLIGIGDSTADPTERAIIQSIRLPRIFLAFLVGAALGISGGIMQGLFRNSMADPGIIGVSSGGATGAVIAIASGASTVSTLFLPLFAFIGSGISMTVVFLIASVGGRFSMATLLLGGIAVSSFLGAVTTATIILTDDLNVQRQIIFWIAGGVDTARWESVRIAAPIIVAGGLISVFVARDLNLLLVSEDEARSLGVRVTLVRNTLLVSASLITGAAVAFSGIIAFVGLIVPHVVRLVVGADHRVLLPLSALAGGLFLLIADTAARIVLSPAELRVGILTALIGAPFFIYLLVRNRSRASML
ncbi:MAG: iron chelate uptake ABC transporter family permease subunit [Chloroflexi bacterium]|nr:iron chelate uptake ABC transporter family permease subunit [Chloroflexota bacterium]